MSIEIEKEIEKKIFERRCELLEVSILKIFNNYNSNNKEVFCSIISILVKCIVQSETPKENIINAILEYYDQYYDHYISESTKQAGKIDNSEMHM
jgi:hypothetical protein